MINVNGIRLFFIKLGYNERIITLIKIRERIHKVVFRTTNLVKNVSFSNIMHNLMKEAVFYVDKA